MHLLLFITCSNSETIQSAVFCGCVSECVCGVGCMWGVWVCVFCVLCFVLVWFGLVWFGLVFVLVFVLFCLFFEGYTTGSKCSTKSKVNGTIHVLRNVISDPGYSKRQKCLLKTRILMRGPVIIFSWSWDNYYMLWWQVFYCRSTIFVNQVAFSTPYCHILASIQGKKLTYSVCSPSSSMFPNKLHCQILQCFWPHILYYVCVLLQIFFIAGFQIRALNAL